MAGERPGWLREAPGGCVLSVWVRPGASRSRVVGPYGDALRVRVAAPPQGGAANRELLRLLAAVLGVRAGDLGLASGASGRRKDVRVRGLGVAEAHARLASQVSVDRPADGN